MDIDIYVINYLISLNEPYYIGNKMKDTILFGEKLSFAFIIYIYLVLSKQFSSVYISM